MLKYANFDIVFQEVPEEVTLAINITNCPNQCPGCHSKYLWENSGKQLDTNELYRLVDQYKTGITCVCFMGGDNEPESVAQLANQVKKDYGVKVAWYSGKNELPQNVSATTNQRMMKRLADGRVKDITEWFRRNKKVEVVENEP